MGRGFLNFEHFRNRFLYSARMAPVLNGVSDYSTVNYYEEDDFCAFSKNHKCINWIDYEVARYELEEANSLCHNNWLEINELYEYIHLLQDKLDEAGISYSKR